MKDPYSILGVNKNSTDDEIKAAYRELARKYHPDNYVDNPLSDLASEKMQEINTAYDSIMNMRKNSGGSKGYNYSNTNNNSTNTNYPDIRNYINQGRYDDAQSLLDGIAVERRDAEWYFLNGTVLYRRGWFDASYTSFATACRMDPGNPEYRAAFAHAQRNRGGFNGGYNTMRSQECSTCDLCQGLICADCCCECMGGDLIRCC